MFTTNKEKWFKGLIVVDDKKKLIGSLSDGDIQLF